MLILPVLLALAAALPDRGAARPEDASHAAADTLLAGIDLSDILKQFDPYTISKYDFDVQLQEITAKGSVENLVVSGISGLKLAKTSWSLVEGKLATRILLPSIAAVGQYAVDGKLSASGIELPLQGEGAVTTGFDNLEAEFSINLGISNLGQILLEDFQWTWNMTDIQLHLDGLYGGLALGQMINKILGDILPHLVLKAYHDQITETVASLVMTQGAGYLLRLHKDHAEPQPFRDALDKDDARTARTMDLSVRGTRFHHQEAAEERAGLPVPVALLRLFDADGGLGGLADRTATGTQDALTVDKKGQSNALVDGQVLLSGGVPQRRQPTLGLGTNSEAVRVELRGQPRLLPPGALSSDAGGRQGPPRAQARQARQARQALQVLQAEPPKGLLRADSKAVRVELDGQPRFFPAGALSADSHDEDHEDVLGAGLARPTVDDLPQLRADLDGEDDDEEDDEGASEDDQSDEDWTS